MTTTVMEALDTPSKSQTDSVSIRRSSHACISTTNPPRIDLPRKTPAVLRYLFIRLTCNVRLTPVTLFLTRQDTRYPMLQYIVASSGVAVVCNTVSFFSQNLAPHYPSSRVLCCASSLPIKRGCLLSTDLPVHSIPCSPTYPRYPIALTVLPVSAAIHLKYSGW